MEYFPRIQYVAPQRRSQKFTVQIGRNTRKFHRKNSSNVDVQRHFLWNKRHNEEECLANARLVSLYGTSGTLSKRTVHKEIVTKLQKGCCWNSLRADVQFSVLRLHSPEVNSKEKDMVNCLYTLQPTRKRLRLFFA